MAVIFLQLQKRIMTTDPPTNFHLLQHLFPLIITKEDNVFLTTTSTLDEIRSVVNSLNSQKALSLDSCNGQFYKSCWEIISQDVVDMVQSFFNGKQNLHEINKTLIIPIPKHAAAQDVSNFQPISLCNEICKNHLKALGQKI